MRCNVDRLVGRGRTLTHDPFKKRPIRPTAGSALSPPPNLNICLYAAGGVGRWKYIRQAIRAA